MFSYDTTLRNAVQTPPQSIKDVLEIMQTIEDTCADGDGLKWFNWLYHRVTQAVEARIAAGGFGNSAWLAELDVQFARLYFDALQAFLSGRPAADCWRALFERRNQVMTARIQFALAGINAHINHDLAAALVSTCESTGTSPQWGNPLYAAYTSLNSTLNALVENAKQELHVRLLGQVLPPASQLENAIAAWSITAAREAAWRNAEVLWNLQSLPSVASRFLATLDGLATMSSKVLLAVVVP